MNMYHNGETVDPQKPVMTLQVAGNWLAVGIDQVDRIALASCLWPVPMTRPEYLGLLDTGEELVPVLQLGEYVDPSTEMLGESMIALLHVRGETVGLAIEKPGQVFDMYRLDATATKPPTCLVEVGARQASAADSQFWLIDADQLWKEDRVPTALSPTPA